VQLEAVLKMPKSSVQTASYARLPPVSRDDVGEAEVVVLGEALHPKSVLAGLARDTLAEKWGVKKGATRALVKNTS
jgi:hypothetical protein